MGAGDIGVLVNGWPSIERAEFSGVLTGVADLPMTTSSSSSLDCTLLERGGKSVRGTGALGACILSKEL